MITIKSKEQKAAKKEYDWPENYYRENDPQERLAILKLHESDDGFQIQNALYKKRYITEKQGKKEVFVDTYMRTWLQMQISAAHGVGLFSRKKTVSEWKSFAEAFELNGFSERPASEQELIRMEWKAFLQQLIDSCKSDKMYGSTVFGSFRMSEENLQVKIADDLENITEKFPQELGLEELYLEFHKCAAQVFEENF